MINIFKNNALKKQKERELEEEKRLKEREFYDLWIDEKLHCIDEFVSELLRHKPHDYQIEKDVVMKFVNDECSKLYELVSRDAEYESGLYYVNGKRYKKCNDSQNKEAIRLLNEDIFYRGSFEAIFRDNLVDWHTKYEAEILKQKIIEGGIYLSEYSGRTVIDFKSVESIVEEFPYNTGAIQYKLFLKSGLSLEVIDNVNILDLFIKYKEFHNKKN